MAPNLQRALKAQVVEELRRQNEELRQQVALLQSATSIKNEAVKKATDATPVKSPEIFTPMEGPGETVRHICGGARVPPGTLPKVDENMDGGARTLADLPPVPPWPLEPTGQTKRAHDESFWKIFESGLTVWEEYDRNRPYQGEPVGSGVNNGAVQQHHLRGPEECECATPTRR